MLIIGPDQKQGVFDEKLRQIEKKNCCVAHSATDHLFFKNLLAKAPTFLDWMFFERWIMYSNCLLWVFQTKFGCSIIFFILYRIWLDCGQRIMDRRMYGALIAAPAVAAGFYALYQYKSKKNLYIDLNMPVSGFLSKVRNVIYRNTLQDRLWNYIESRSEGGNADSVLAAFDDYCYNYEWSFAIGDKKGEPWEE